MKSEILKLLNVKRGWIYESILSFSINGKAKVMPMGFFTDDMENIGISIYKTSKILEDLLSKEIFVINLTSDVKFFYQSIFERDKLKFLSTKSNEPYIDGVDGYLELKLDRVVETADKKILISEIKDYELFSKDTRLINRASHLSLEALILVTKLPYLSLETKKWALKSLNEYERIVKKVAPNSEYGKIVDALRKFSKTI